MAVKERISLLLYPFRKGCGEVNVVCPLCNAFEQKDVRCDVCFHCMDDLGKRVDYLDDYSAYEEIVTLKRVDGLSESIARHECVHLFYCSICKSERTVVIQEQVC